MTCVQTEATGRAQRCMIQRCLTSTESTREEAPSVACARAGRSDSAFPGRIMDGMSPPFFRESGGELPSQHMGEVTSVGSRAEASRRRWAVHSPTRSSVVRCAGGADASSLTHSGSMTGASSDLLAEQFSFVEIRHAQAVAHAPLAWLRPLHARLARLLARLLIRTCKLRRS